MHHESYVSDISFDTFKELVVLTIDIFLSSSWHIFKSSFHRGVILSHIYSLSLFIRDLVANEILEYKEYTFPLWIGSLDFGLGLRLGLVKKGIVIQVTVCQCQCRVWSQCVVTRFFPRGHPLLTGHSPLSSQLAGAQRAGDKFFWEDK